MADIGLQPVYGQDRPPLLLEPLLQAGVPRKSERHQLLVAIEQIGNRALRDTHPPSRKLPVNLRHTAVLGVTQGAHQGDDVQAELTLGKRESPFLFRSVWLVVKLAI
jgi:hypothetical protein